MYAWVLSELAGVIQRLLCSILKGHGGQQLFLKSEKRQISCHLQIGGPAELWSPESQSLGSFWSKSSWKVTRKHMKDQHAITKATQRQTASNNTDCL